MKRLSRHAGTVLIWGVLATWIALVLLVKARG